MKLDLLLEHVDKKVNGPLPYIEVEGISTNSSSVHPNDLFIAIPGFRVDGHDFILEAIEAGASAIVGEKNLESLPVPYIQVPNSRFALAKLACQFYDHPSRNKKVIGITGTNGKTTTSYMLKTILEASGHSCALFGTVQNVVNGQAAPSLNTTPDALELQKQLSLSKDEFIVMEVSSHGLTQYRVEGVEFDYCLFTNLDHDHLDYHHDMEAYFDVKVGLFNQLKPGGRAIINHYNRWGEKLTERLTSKGHEMHIVGGEHHHDLRISQFNSGVSKMILEGNQQYELKITILGKHNMLNAAMAFLTAQKLGLPQKDILQALEMFAGVPGRFEMLQHPKGATIVVDYAHTADAFYHCLQTAREEGAKRVFHIFGFRGGRDVKKRQRMVSISQEISDGFILTLDDLNDVPYEEMERALYELNNGGDVILDRTLAIQKTLEHVDEGDWVCITGKGSGNYQQEYHLPTTSDIDTVQYLIQQRMI